MEDERETSSLRHRRRKSSISIPSCFHCSDDKSRTPPARSRFHDLAEFRKKHQRIGRYRRLSADFSYDPMSYALNFDNGDSAKSEDEARMRNFSGNLAQRPAEMEDVVGSVAPPSTAVAREVLVEIC